MRRPLAGPPRRRIHAVILAGGSGERFWPLSRARRPKPFLALGGRQALLAETVARARRFAGHVWVVCGRAHAREVMRVTGLPARRVLVEPEKRNTAPAIGFAAARIAAEAPDALMVVLPADHRIPDAAAFARAARRAAAAAARAGALVTLGVRPTRPDAGYGWIVLGPRVPGVPGLHRVRRFVEKPPEARARRLLRRGGVLWNAGIFAWEARTILEEIERCAPAVHRALGPMRQPSRGRAAAEAARRAFRRAPARSIDHAVLEKSRRVLVLPVDFAWSDVGTWASLADSLGVRPGQNRTLGPGALVAQDAGGNLVRGAGRLVALVGVEGLAVIDSGDALLVARLDRSAGVRAVVRRLRARGRRDLV